VIFSWLEKVAPRVRVSAVVSRLSRAMKARPTYSRRAAL
jgi:hypothetical protein